MNVRRLRKQITYAVIYGIFWLVVVGVPVMLMSQPQGSRPAPPAAPTAAPQPITVQSVDVIHHERSVDVVARLNNPNAHMGVVHYPVSFILLDSTGTEIARAPIASHVLPGSVQYISALNIPVESPVSKVVLETPKAPTYAHVSSTMTLPSFSTFLREQTTRSVGGQNLTEQKGIVTNSGTLDWQYVEVTAVALDAADRPVGVGTTFVGRLTSGEQREFTVQWPASGVPAVRVVTVATTNIFKEDNIIRAVGDPALLR